MKKDIDIFYSCENIMALHRCTMGQGVAFPGFFFYKKATRHFNQEKQEWKNFMQPAYSANNREIIFK